jgi:hypothetical protein
MTTRSTTHRNVPTDKVLTRIPHRLRNCCDVSLLRNESVNLIVFEPGEGHIVASKDVAKALNASREIVGRIVAIGYDFTDEARALVDEQGGLVFSERGFHGWTDESLRAVKTRLNNR